MKKIPISGGPHTGKTTLLNALRVHHPEAYFVEEAAEKVINTELRKEEASQSYRGIYPVSNYRAFAPLVVAASVELEQAIPPDTEHVFLDRSLIDNIGYMILNDCRDLISGLEHHIARADYALAFFCEPVGEYTTTAIRHETREQAQAIHKHLEAAYKNSGIEIVHLPAVGIDKRLQIISSHL